MEGRLGVELFARTNGGTHPTEAGREFLEFASHILAETDSALRCLQTRSRGENGHLAIGIYASLATGNMYATLVDYRRKFPDVEVQTFDGDHRQLMRAIDRNAIDIAIMSSNRPDCPCRILPLWSERVIVALCDEHSLSAREVVHWSDLAGESILVPEHGPGPELERLLVSKLGDGASQHLSRQATGLDRLLTLVKAEFGILLMLEGGTGIHIDGVTYRELHDVNGPTRLDFSAYWRESNANPTLGPFVTMLRRRYPDLSVTFAPG
jgi:DNA-binding transcriptional LysR family regulator